MLKTLDKKKYSLQFIDYLVNSILKPQLRDYCNDIKLQLFSNEFNINANDAFKKLINNIVINQTSNDYIIEITNNMYNNMYSYKDLFNIFEWGNMNVKGLNLLPTLFDDIFNRKINILYEMYLKGVDFS